MSSILKLNPDELCGIASFLFGQEASQFASSCQQIHSDLSVGILKNLHPIGDCIRLHEHDDNLHLLTELTPFPLLVPARIHSVRIMCDWKDQGWGNRKGRLLITSSSETQRNPEIVMQSEIAPHQESRWRRGAFIACEKL
eukprot:scaffold44207_cov50-Attheya_sp.AAC.1